MKKMDEMDRNIYMRSEEWGYKVSLLSLCIWTIFNLYQSFYEYIQLYPISSAKLSSAFINFIFQNHCN